MAARAVHWHEGVFLQPQHFQLDHRHLADRGRRAAAWAHHHVWGLKSFALDPDALLNNRLVVRHLRCLLRDGTPVEVPDDAVLPALDLKAAFTPGQPLTVFLALPVLNLGRANATDDPDDPTARYRLDSQELEDENTGVNPQPVQVRVPNVRLLLSGQDQTGYTTLPLCRLVRSAAANAPPELDATYIPPLLACDAWTELRAGVLQATFDRIGRKRGRLAEQLAGRGAGVGSLDPTDVTALAHLRELNAAYAALSVLAFSPGIAPLPAYVELCRLVGQLAVFDRTGRWPAIPAYDHDDLGGCFWRVKMYLDSLLDILPEPEYKERPFTGVGTRLQVAVEPTWLDPAWGLFLGVQNDVDPDEAVRLLTLPGQLDMKVGSGDRVDAIFQLGQAGLKFEACPRPGRLPDSAALRYFRIGRSPDKEWAQVVRALTLAVRFNETRVVGQLNGQRAVTVRTGGGQTATMTFTLFAVPSE